MAYPILDPPVVRLAHVARAAGAIAFDLRRKWARNGWFLRLWVPGRSNVYDVVLAAERHGFVCATPIREVGESYQVCITIPDLDVADLRQWLAAGSPVALPTGPRALPS